MKYLSDGTPISSNTISINEIQHKINNGTANSVYLATVQKLFYPDESKNLNRREVEYQIRIESGPKIGRIYNNVRSFSLYGGIVNFSETIYSPADKVLDESKAKKNKSVLRFYSDASQVLVIFLDGYEELPIIIGGFTHTARAKLFTKKKDGIRKIEEFNGIRLEINDDGEYILTYLGGKRDTKTKKTKRPTTAPTTFKIDKNGNFILEQREVVETYGESITGGKVLNSITMDRKKKSYTQTIGDHLFAISDESGKESFTILHKIGSIINMDEKGSIALITKNGNTLNLNNDKNEISLIQKSGNLFSLKDDEITIADKTGKQIITVNDEKIQLTAEKTLVFQSGALDLNMGTLNLTGQQEVNIKDVVGAKLHIKSGKIALGSPAAELLDIVDQLLQSTMDLIDQINSHTHLGNMGYPTGVPINIAAFTAIKTQIQAIKTLLSLIKGTL